MSRYRVRPATLDDLEVLVRHRLAMFLDMGAAAGEVAEVGAPYNGWLRDAMARGLYRAWLVETDTGQIVAGGGMTELPWPPGPHYPGGRIAFVYNVYTEPAHRGRGLARQVMETIHDWCLAAGIGAVGLNASAAGRRLYESLGYQLSESPAMFRRIG
jgi:GNAT superfamily N-acetyltransferase